MNVQSDIAKVPRLMGLTVDRRTVKKGYDNRGHAAIAAIDAASSDNDRTDLLPFLPSKKPLVAHHAKLS